MHLSDQNIYQPGGVTVNQNNPEKQGTSEDTKTLVTVILLIFVYPIGFLLMWFWAKWKTWVKFLVSCLSCLPVLFIILAILGAGILTAINPVKQFSLARDTQRRADLNTLSMAIVTYMADNQGQLPPGLTKICPETHRITSFDLNLETILVPKYLPKIPLDPSTPVSADNVSIPVYNVYEICIADPATNRFTVSAPKAESETPISVTR